MDRQTASVAAIAIVALAVFAYAGTVGVPVARHIALAPDEITFKPGPASLPAGSQIAILEGNPASPGPFTFRLKFPSGYTIAPHWHPVPEHITVISGTFNLGTGDVFDKARSKALPAGSFVVVQPGMHHFAWADGETVVQVHSVGPTAVNYVNPADDPRKR